MTIKTKHEYPPIPDRRFDWRAWHEGEEEHNHCGWGPTETEAIDDLRRLDNERADWEEHEDSNRERLAFKYSHIGCPAARYEDNCAHPDRCADNGRCIDLGAEPF